MIVHRISPHAYVQPEIVRPAVGWGRPAVAPVYPIRPMEPYEFSVALGQGRVVSKINRQTAKVVYAQWLSSLGFVRGDYIVHRRTYDSKMVRSQFNYLRVVQLQEVHMLLDFNDIGQAKALELVSSSGTRFWTCPHEWVKEDAPANPAWHFDVPQC